MESPSPSLRKRDEQDEGLTRNLAATRPRSFEEIACRMDLADLFASTIPCTFRLEYRNSTSPTSPGLSDGRLLIFRSDKAGAIAKLVFSHGRKPAPESHESVSVATIQCLECKQQFRGHDFGGLLFTETINSLRSKLVSRSVAGSFIHCQLDAEEDERRYGRLLKFYEKLGCHVREKAKIQFINNNDGETYRKVPMYLDVRGDDPSRWASCEGGRLERFVPVTFKASNGMPVQVRDESIATSPKPARRLDHWLLLQNDANNIEVWTTVGHRLYFDNAGSRVLVPPTSTVAGECTSVFQLYRVPDDFENDPRFCGKLKVTTSLWTIRSVERDYYLSICAKGDSPILCCATTPSYWQADDSYGLTSTTQTPSQRRHYSLHWQTQCVAYVAQQKDRYLQFRSFRMSLREALDLAQTIPADPWTMDADTCKKKVSGSPLVSLRTLCFHCAEYFRRAGHPDWVQLLALLYELGNVLQGSSHDASGTYEWTRSSRSRVLGCPVSSRAEYGEFQPLNPDESDLRYTSTSTGMYTRKCGFDHVVLSWTGPEYMYHMLVHNQVGIPEDALKMLRLASLSEWHSPKHGNDLAYVHICSDADYALQSIVADFDDGIQQASRSLDKYSDLTSQQCDTLWTSYYASIAAKYGRKVDDMLEW